MFNVPSEFFNIKEPFVNELPVAFSVEVAPVVTDELKVAALAYKPAYALPSVNKVKDVALSEPY